MKQLTTVWGGYDLRALVLRGIRVCRRDGSRVWPGDREVSGLEGSHQKTLGKME